MLPCSAGCFEVALANGWSEGPRLHLASSCFSGFVAQAVEGFLPPAAGHASAIFLIAKKIVLIRFIYRMFI